MSYRNVDEMAADRGLRGPRRSMVARRFPVSRRSASVPTPRTRSRWADIAILGFNRTGPDTEGEQNG